MKTIKTVLVILFVSYFINNSYGQMKDKNILKVTYSGGCISDFMIGMLKKQIQDPVQYSNILNKMRDYKMHTTYYQNLKTKESIFVLDSISEVGGMSTAGYTYYVLRNKEGNISGKENFMGKNIDYKGNESSIKWVITNEQKEINGYKCKKASLKDNSEVYVWFAPEIAVNGGPSTFFGLQGLVMESNGIFESFNALTISYSSTTEFEKKLDEVTKKVNNDKAITLEEVFAKKSNFQQMIQKGN